MRNNKSIFIVGVLCIIAITGCGGDDGNTDYIGNKAPVANAGPDQNVTTGSLVTLDGSVSNDADGDILTYSWSFTSMPAGSTAAQSISAVVNPVFTADKDGAYVLSLVVNDGQVSSVADTVTITAATVDTTAPTIPKGLTASVISSSQINLTWSASSDAAGVTGYTISRDGAYLKSVVSTSTSDAGLTASIQYCYLVSAYDAAGNVSVVSSQSCATTSAQTIIISGNTLTFTKVEKYFVKNSATLTPPTDFLVLHNRAEFDLTFSPWPPPQIATQFDMTNRFILSIIKNGNATWAMDVQSVTLDGTALKVYYSASKTADNLSWIGAFPLNILLDNVGYSKVQFFENGNLTKEL